MVIVAHRPHRWLQQSVASVVDQADEVVLVDNGSGGSEVSGAGRRLEVRVVRSDTNLGFAGGANLGLTAATGDVVGLLNDDAMAEPGWLATAVEVLADPSVGAVAPKTLFAHPHAEVRFDDEPWFAPGDPRPLGRYLSSVMLDGRDVLPTLTGPGVHRLESGQREEGLVYWRWTSGREATFVPLPDGADPSGLVINGEPAPVRQIVTLVNNAGCYLSAEGYGGDYGFLSPDVHLFDEPADRFAASGVAMVTRQETLVRLGLFAPRFFAYYEDLDWSWRAQLAGMRIRYDPRAIVHHVGGVTSGGPADQFVRFLAARNRILALARNAPTAVLARQIVNAWVREPPPGLRRSLGVRLPEALTQRRGLSGSWRRRPLDVWRQWAAVGETWPTPGP